MNLDFPAIMVIATFVTGVIWLIDERLWRPKRTAKVEELKHSYAGADKEEVISRIEKEPIIVEYAKSFFPVILIVLILRSFFFEPFRIPSGSMIPTLKVGDFILVNKFDYGIRLPVINTKIFDIGSPERGDVFVFRFPRDPSVDYIKRVIGLPGDRISYRAKNLYVNGKRIESELTGPYIETKDGMPIPGANVLSEKISDAVTHNILIDSTRPSYNGEWVVPEGNYFAMGDNRDNSNDSRYWGTVPEENLVGRAFMIWMNWNYDDGGVEWSRIGKSID